MEQLTEMDYAMLQVDSARTPQLISTLALYDGSALQDGPLDFQAIRKAFSRLVTKSAMFRRRVSDKARGWDTPFWINDANFDLDFHVRHIALPQPGDWRQLCNQAARLHANQLDMSRPLWEAYVIEGIDAVEGLPKGSFAVMLKLHHAAVDGVAVARMIDLLNGPECNGEAAADIEDDWEGEDEPSMMQVWSKGYENSKRRQRQMMQNIKGLVPKVIRSNKNKGNDKDKDKKNESKPYLSVFNERVSSRRTVGAHFLKLDQFKGIRSAIPGPTINDIAISVVGGAMRQYLIELGQLPDKDLLTAAPISIREVFEGDVLGNEVSNMNIRLGVDIADPIERLKMVHESAKDAKQRAEELGKRTMLDVTNSLSPTILGLGFKLISRMAGSTDALFPVQTIVSNVPGPREPRFLAGCELHSVMALGPLMDGLGIFHGIVSAGGRIPLSFCACGDIVTDPEFYEQCLRQSWNELENAVKALPASKPPVSEPSAKKRREVTARAKAEVPGK